MKATSAYRLKAALAWLLAGAGATGSAAMATAMSFPNLDVPLASNLAMVQEMRADAAVQRNAPSSEALNRAVIAAAPMTPAAWLRIAYLQTRDGGALKPSGLEALEKSYAIAPFGPDISLWRLTFIYDHWPLMTPSLRAQAAAELETLSRSRGQTFDVRTISNASGRFSAQMTEAAAINLQGIDRATDGVAR